ncbi:MAG: tetratricopeptide repeat protein [Deltaproteobacteria bacterium]|nr:tetratricopeptide repeat protein [Deltaproteobacteria bacterium]
MPESYKKWILIGIAFMGIFFVVLVLYGPSFKNREVAESGLRTPVPPPPQFTDSNQMTVLPVEELMVDTGDPQSLARLGDEYFESGNYRQAIEIYKKALEINPKDIDTLNDLGLAYHYTGNSDLAEEVLIKGTEVDPAFQRIWLSLGYVLKSAGKNEQAISVLQKTVKLGPDNEVGQEAIRMLGQ